MQMTAAMKTKMQRYGVYLHAFCVFCPGVYCNGDEKHTGNLWGCLQRPQGALFPPSQAGASSSAGPRKRAKLAEDDDVEEEVIGGMSGVLTSSCMVRG